MTDKIFDIEGIMKEVERGRMEGSIDQLHGENQRLRSMLRQQNETIRQLHEAVDREYDDRMRNGIQADRLGATLAAYRAQARVLLATAAETGLANPPEDWLRGRVDDSIKQGAKKYREHLEKKGYAYDNQRDALVLRDNWQVGKKAQLGGLIDAFKKALTQTHNEYQERAQQQYDDRVEQRQRQQKKSRDKTLDKVAAIGVGQR